MCLQVAAPNPFSTKPIGTGLDLGLLQVLYVPAEYGLILQPLMVIIANFHLSKATIDGTRALKATYQVLSLSPTQTPTLSMAMNLTCHVRRLGQHNLLRSAHHKGPTCTTANSLARTSRPNNGKFYVSGNPDEFSSHGVTSRGAGITQDEFRGRFQGDRGC